VFFEVRIQVKAIAVPELVPTAIRMLSEDAKQFIGLSPGTCEVGTVRGWNKEFFEVEVQVHN
jgi:hypothetical protein